MKDLARRYSRWLALCYPASYRRERGSELVDTYLSLAGPGTRRPSVADVADLARGGLRQHVRGAAGLDSGFRLAGLLSLTTATALATFWTFVEARNGVSASGSMSLGALPWGAWLLAAMLHVVAPGRRARWAVGLAALATAGIVPVAALLGVLRPPLVVLLPQLVLGIVALGAGGGRTWWGRLAPLALAAAVAAIGVLPEPELANNYYSLASAVLSAVALSMLVGAALIAVGLSVRRDHRGLWALLILLTPMGMLTLNSLGAMLDDSGPGRPIVAQWSSMMAAATLVAVVGPALLPVVLALRGRFS